MTLAIKQVKNFQDMAVFIRIPDSIPGHRKLQKTIPADRLSSYDPSSNPVHMHLKSAYFIAFRNSIPAGRIAAIRDFLNPDPDTGFFGCFDCENSPGTASALLEAARAWLAENGMCRMIGPATFNTNQQVGTLIEGFDLGPQLMLPYNPPFYGELLEKAGLVKITDLVTYSWHREMGIPEKITRIAGHVRETGRVSMRRLNLHNVFPEARLVKDMFNRSMSSNWGFIPLTDGETSSMINFCRSYADPDLLLSVWDEGHPAGILLFLPTGLPGRAASRTVRAAILGVVPEYRHRGLDSLMIERAIHIIFKKGYEQADISMIHEDNRVMRKIVEEVIGAQLTRRYRVYGTR